MPGFQHLLLPDFKPTNNVANRCGQCGSDGLNFSQASRRSDIGAATTFLSDAATEGFRGDGILRRFILESRFTSGKPGDCTQTPATIRSELGQAALRLVQLVPHNRASEVPVALIRSHREKK